MSTHSQHCEHCQQPLAPDSRFCEWCGKPVSRQQAAPTPQQPDRPPSPARTPAPQAASTSPSASSSVPPMLLIALFAGGALFICLLAAVGGVLLWQRGQAAPSPTPSVVSSTPVAVMPTAMPQPTETTALQPTETAAPDLLESPAAVVDDFVRATLGTVPGAAIDYDQARSLMTAAYAREFDSAGFVPIAYGIQDGPTTYEIGDEETSGSTATVTVLGYWGGELGRRWGFTLQQEEGAWRIAAINSLPVASPEPMPDAASDSLEALIGEWEIVEGDVDAGERFRLQLEPDGRLRLRLVDEYIDIEGIEDLERFYLELEPEGVRRWVGDAVNVEWNPETDEITEWSREPVVILLSDDGEEMLLGPPESEGVIARRVP